MVKKYLKYTRCGSLNGVLVFCDYL